eukprot:364520-Chlamydomonas_euryale.AAC.6
MRWMRRIADGSPCPSCSRHMHHTGWSPPGIRRVTETIGGLQVLGEVREMQREMETDGRQSVDVKGWR